MDPRINFITLVVADLDRARRFYLDGLGWAAALDVGGEVAMIHVGNKLVLSLWAKPLHAPRLEKWLAGGTLPFTLAHNVASPSEVDAVLLAAKNAGATVHAAVQRRLGVGTVATS